MSTSAHRRWLRKAEHWGEWKRVPVDRPGPPESIFLLRGASGRARFYARGKGQVGTEHASVVAAAYWAWGEGWLLCEPDGTVDLAAQLRCRRWVQGGGADVDGLEVSLVGASPPAAGERSGPASGAPGPAG